MYLHSFHVLQTEDGYTSPRLSVLDPPYTAPCHVIHCPIITPARGHVAAAERRDSLCMPHFIAEYKAAARGGGLRSHCQDVMTCRTCIITDFLSLSYWLSFPESCT